MRVMFRDQYGSIGTADDKPNTNGRIYVTWNYGKDTNGNPITATSNYDNYNQLMEISEEHFLEYTECLAWSEEQKAIKAKILGTAKLNESKKCRECAHWGADPDSEYCGHPKALEVSPVGISLERGRGNISRKPAKPEDDLAFSICGPEGKLWEKRPPSRR